MAVYKISLQIACQPPYDLVCKIPHARRLTYTPGTQHHTEADTTRDLLDRLVTLADHLAQTAPGLFPRSGGAWHWQDTDGVVQHVLVEEFIPGLSVERLQLHYEQQMLSGALTTEVYQRQRLAAERLAVAAFTRLWDRLERRMFTSDPSPWNVLVRQPDAEPIYTQTATIIDLHGLEEDVGLPYVVQRLAAVYGMRQEVLVQAVLPGILDTLGAEEGKALLLAALPQLEIDADTMRRNLGVDVQKPLLSAIRALA
jgi:hypothetical protein